MHFILKLTQTLTTQYKKVILVVRSKYLEDHIWPSLLVLYHLAKAVHHNYLEFIQEFLIFWIG